LIASDETADYQLSPGQPGEELGCLSLKNVNAIYGAVQKNSHKPPSSFREILITTAFIANTKKLGQR
jgi:hypothetical protein